MFIRVCANHMTVLMYLFYNVRVLLYFFPEQKKCGFYTAFFQSGEQLLRIVRVWAVVKRNGNFFYLLWACLLHIADCDSGCGIFIVTQNNSKRKNQEDSGQEKNILQRKNFCFPWFLHQKYSCDHSLLYYMQLRSEKQQKFPLSFPFWPNLLYFLRSATLPAARIIFNGKRIIFIFPTTRIIL